MVMWLCTIIRDKIERELKGITDLKLLFHSKEWEWQVQFLGLKLVYFFKLFITYYHTP